MFVNNGTMYTGLRFMLPEERQVAQKVHSVNIYVEVTESVNGTPKTFFREFNTYGDFHLIPTSMPFIVPPPIKDMSVEVPGSENGVVDMNEALTGSPLYSIREGTLEFMYENAYRTAHVSHSTEWNDTWHTETEPIDSYKAAKSDDPTGGPTPGANQRTFFSTGMYHRGVNNLNWAPFYMYGNMMNYVHGRRVYLSLMDEPENLYQGRIYVESINPGEDNAGKVNIKYKLNVYRRPLTDGSYTWSTGSYRYLVVPPLTGASHPKSGVNLQVSSIKKL